MDDRSHSPDPFSFHTGFAVHPSGVDQMVTDCPFCKKEKHFYFSTANHMWDCKVCGKEGNLITFLRELYDMFKTQTAASEILSQIRNLPRQVFERQGIKYNPLNQTYLYPTWKDNKVSTLYKVVSLQEKQPDNSIKIKLRPYCTPYIGHSIVNWQEEHQEVWLAEGHWDKLAGDTIIGSRKITVLGIPGANVFKDVWMELIHGKDLVMFYHPDEGGRAGMKALVDKHIAASHFKPKTISYCEWGEENIDLNKLYIQHGKASYAEVEKRIRPYVHSGTTGHHTAIVHSTLETTISDKTCTTFNNLIERLGTSYYITPSFKGMLLATIASVYSVKIEGEQLWFRGIGIPGGSKSTIATLVSTSPQVVLRSTFTGLFSGWSDDDPSDASIIPQISGKSLIIKDADALLQQPNCQQILSELRDFYDKNSSVQYKNRRQYDYRDVRTTFILFGTRALRLADDTMLGERFLDYEITVTPEERKLICSKMMEQSYLEAINQTQISNKKLLYASAKGFIDNIFSQELECRCVMDELNKIQRHADLAAMLRTRVNRGPLGTGEIRVTPQDEMATRIGGQMLKYVLCASHVLGLASPSDYVFKELSKITLDIIDRNSIRYRMLDLLLEHAQSAAELATNLDLPLQRICIELDNLRALYFVKDKIEHTGAGRAVRKFQPISSIQEGLIEIGQ